MVDLSYLRRRRAGKSLYRHRSVAGPAIANKFPFMLQMRVNFARHRSSAFNRRGGVV